jgi:hypothetical protein
MPVAAERLVAKPHLTALARVLPKLSVTQRDDICRPTAD